MPFRPNTYGPWVPVMRWFRNQRLVFTQFRMESRYTLFLELL